MPFGLPGRQIYLFILLGFVWGRHWSKGRIRRRTRTIAVLQRIMTVLLCWRTITTLNIAANPAANRTKSHKSTLVRQAKILYLDSFGHFFM